MITRAAGLGIRNRLTGRQTNRLTAAHPKQAPRQPNAPSSQAESGQPTVLAKPAIKVIPVIALRASRP